MQEKRPPHLNRACTEKEYTVTPNDLPLSCPSPKYRLWDAHPRVYLPIEVTKREICPYCGAIYVLKSETDPQFHEQ